jgi:PKD repeat protein
VAGPTASHTYASSGNFTVTLTVWDSNNQSATASSQVSAGAPASQSLAASLRVTPTSGIAPVTVSASTAASSGTITSSVINFGDGTVMSGTSASHTYKSSGKFTITATVRNSQGVSASTTAQVNVSSSLPVAVLQVTPQSGRAPLLVTASASASSNPAGGTLSGTINFGDGTTVSGLTATHKYHQAGIYTVKATVRNSSGSASATAQVNVSAPNADFKVDAKPSTLAAGAYTYQLTVTADRLLFSPVFLSCAAAPAGASCSFTPRVVTPGQLPVHSMLTISLPRTADAGSSSSLPIFALWLPIPGLALLGAGVDRKSSRKRWTGLLLGCLLIVALLATGCGGGSFSPSSTNATSANAVTVLAKSATGTHTVTIYLPQSSGVHKRH